MNPVNANVAIKRLEEGNERFRNGRIVGPGRARPGSEELMEAQRPFAVILSCSDSRVPPELVFDAGLGDLFVIRVAGNIADGSTIASVEFAVANLGASLVVVMAHEKCGAVTAAVRGGDLGKNLKRLIGHIQPALESAERDIDAAARRNARISAERLVKESDIIRAATEKGGVQIITAFYHISNGKVVFD